MIPAPDTLDEQALRRLLEAGRALVDDLDLDGVLDRLLRAALEITGARYAALGILDRRREQLERFVTLGVDEAVRREIGEPPRGRGVLGVLIEDPRPLRLESVSADPRAYGFPPGHPAMATFLGVPLLVRDEAWGNLYLTEKAEPFTQADEDAVVVLAAWAAVAIENARLYHDSERRRAELARAVRGLEATNAIALAVGGETDMHAVLELIVTRGRALVDANGVAILLRDEDGLSLAAQVGTVPEADLLSSDDGDFVPLVFRGRTLGMLVAFGVHGGGDEALLRAFAASAATAVATARTVEEKRLRGALASAEAERARWARELHDDTLQGLGGLRLLLVAARRSGDADTLGGAIDRLEQEIDGLRGLIRDLRPAALDDLGLGPAIEGLAERAARREGLDVIADVNLPDRLSAELETAAYRIVQEALTNAVRHSGATSVRISVDVRDGAIHAEVSDDGRGFDPADPSGGFGLTGMRERVALLRGELEVASSESGTSVSAALPIEARTGILSA